MPERKKVTTTVHEDTYAILEEMSNQRRFRNSVPDVVHAAILAYTDDKPENQL